MPNPFRAFLENYRKAYRHQGGIKALALGRLDPDWFVLLQQEMAGIIATEASSNVADPAHTTNWTRPIGEARQFSLFNPTGRCDEYLSDFASTTKQPKRLVFPQLKGLARVARLFGPELLNLRLNGLGTNSGLSLHEEDPIETTAAGRKYRARFHIPIFTNPNAAMLLDGEEFHFREGILYFFHHGCVHAARNLADSPRYHIVLDCMLEPALHRRLFPGTPSPDPGFVKFDAVEAKRIPGGRTVPFGEFVTETGRVVSRLDYGRKVPTWFDWARTSYPSAFRPIDRLVGRTAEGAARNP